MQPDTIINVVKKCFGELYDHLEFILELNTARVTPDFKGGDRSKLGYCRSLPVLPYFSKIYQHIMYNRFQKYVLQKIIYPKHFGFQVGYSTDNAINQYNDQIFEVLKIPCILSTPE